ncbi:hypothetical protein [Luteolibacter luteus]|uniref:Uncharacterized protein n=1 Tax=Luteolibacter luteus TaxID=2728835 RepID=A0A858RG30_9BACT|nr:hypothetical protein [Luteolibacter luteus]QJE95389.1 hypothetical protein HHL09_06205 [Luteolibacter luteus]
METEPTLVRDYRVPLLERLKENLVQTVPEEIAVCEFDCDHEECSPREWKHCLRRLTARNKQPSAVPS